MSLKPIHPDLDKEDLKFISELGWLAAVALAIVDFVPAMFT